MTLILRSLFDILILMYTFASFSPIQTLFLIIVPLFIVVTLVLALVHLYKKKNKVKKFKENYFKKIKRIVFDNDYYLLNEFYFKVEFNKIASIDHIIFADKYIFVINDYYYEGDLLGDENDNSLVLLDEEGHRHYIENLYHSMDKTKAYFSIVTGISQPLIVGISLINSECALNIKTKNSYNYIIQLNKLKDLIKAIESRDVSKINEEQLAKVVKEISALNRKKK